MSRVAGRARDEADYAGISARTWGHARPRHPGMKQAGTKNPVSLPTKSTSSACRSRADPRRHCSRCYDRAETTRSRTTTWGFRSTSASLFIATANFVQKHHRSAMDRMEMVEFSGYTDARERRSPKKYLIPASSRKTGSTTRGDLHRRCSRQHRGQLTPPNSGCWQLELQVGAVCRKVARRVATGNDGILTDRRIDADEVRESSAARASERADETERGRHCHGHVLTRPVGWRIMSSRRRFAAAKAPSSNEDGETASRYCRHPMSLILTGQLGGRQEGSARAAITYVTNSAPASDSGASARRRDGAHISAGGRHPRRMAVAGMPSPPRWCRRCLVARCGGTCLTGEITLRGRVLPIGGLKEKVLGAHRAGSSTSSFLRERCGSEDVPEE